MTAIPRGLRRILAAFLCMTIVIPGTATAGGQAEKRMVVIDDDGFGLMHMMLLNAPDVDVLGITTVSGNMWVNRLTALSLRGIEIADRTEVPVYQGATHPLLNSEVQSERWEALYGKLTWKGAWMKQWVEPTIQSEPSYFGPNDPVELPGGNPSIKAQDEIAANFLIRTVRANPGKVTILAAGPMTNLALAQRLDPEFASLAKELVYMGGSLAPRQVLDNAPAAEFAREFVNTPRREFNIHFDPEAASIVSRSPWRKITVIPIDPTTETQLTRDLLARMAAVSSPEIAAYIRAMEPNFPLWDETAAGVWLQPELIREQVELHVDYNTQFGPSYGDMMTWFEPYAPGLGEQPAAIIKKVDPAGLEALMVRLIANGRARE